MQCTKVYDFMIDRLVDRCGHMQNGKLDYVVTMHNCETIVLIIAIEEVVRLLDALDGESHKTIHFRLPQCALVAELLKIKSAKMRGPTMKVWVNKVRAMW